MKTMLPVFAALMLVFVSSQAIAQSKDDQESCEGDVFDLCADEIPDEDAIVACLRKKWSKVSKECRHVMASHGKGKKKSERKSKSGRAGANDSGY